jgi:hypothetical protein
MRRRFDHIDLRVAQLVAAFYETLLPALGFARRADVEGWLQFESADGAVGEFFGAESVADVDRVAKVAARAGARNIEGPMDYEPGYYAAFFKDPCGNRLEVCHRLRA